MGLSGAITRETFDSLLARMPEEKFDANERSIDLLIGQKFKSRFVVKNLLQILKAEGFRIRESIASGEQYTNLEKTGDYDLSINFLGSSETDPDSAWRIYNQSILAEPVATSKELDQAQLEAVPAVREKLYQDFEMKLVDRALLIPLRNEATYYLTRPPVQIDVEQANSWGLQLFQLRSN